MKLVAVAFLVILSILQIGCEEERPIFTTGNPPIAPLGVEAEDSTVNATDTTAVASVWTSVAIGKDASGKGGDEAVPQSCYLTCTQTCVAQMCDGLSGAEHQQCSNDCAEGCRCSCGLPCP